MNNETEMDNVVENELDKGNTPSFGPAKVVVPGEVLKESMDMLPGTGTFREGKNIISKVLGIEKTDGRVISVTPLSGVYIPQKRDTVIGEITGINFSNWSVDIGGPYEANLSIAEVQGYIERDADLSRFYAVGELIFVKIHDISKTKYVSLSMKDPKARKLSGGLIVDLTPSKVPRLIGKAGSMIQLIKQRTNTMISVGQNGRVWIKGEHEEVAVRAIKMVEDYSHTSGLTDKISEMLDKELGKAKEQITL
ncbi:MAG: exosome complex RNA-binding protein Rrp4 [archaeon]